MSLRIYYNERAERVGNYRLLFLATAASLFFLLLQQRYFLYTIRENDDDDSLCDVYLVVGIFTRAFVRR